MNQNPNHFYDNRLGDYNLFDSVDSLNGELNSIFLSVTALLDRNSNMYFIYFAQHKYVRKSRKTNSSCPMKLKSCIEFMNHIICRFRKVRPNGVHVQRQINSKSSIYRKWNSLLCRPNLKKKTFTKHTELEQTKKISKKTDRFGIVQFKYTFIHLRHSFSRCL